MTTPFSGLPAAASVEQSIVFAQLELLRRLDPGPPGGCESDPVVSTHRTITGRRPARPDLTPTHRRG